MSARTRRYLAAENLTMVQTSAKQAGICPVCMGAAKIVESNGDSNPCDRCDGTGSFGMWEAMR